MSQTKNINQKMLKETLETYAFKFIGWIGTIQSVLIHTLLFTLSFMLLFFGVSSTDVLLILTTIVSLEAIYLSIFIQMAVNKNTKSIEVMHNNIEDVIDDIEEVKDDIEEIKEDTEEEKN